jgi:hypothetical protein
MRSNQCRHRCSIAIALIVLAGTCSAWQPLLSRGRHRTAPLRAKRGKKGVRAAKKRSAKSEWLEKQEAAQRRLQGGATDIRPATVRANGVIISEDHRQEQFFFDAPTSAKMMRLVGRFEKPLLVCVPSIAAKLDAAGEDYLLLDRDERFATLKSFEPFDLRQPKPVTYTFDALFLDPPFASVTPLELAAAVAALCGDRRVPLFVGLQRTAELVEAFDAYDLRDTGDVLGYATGVMEGKVALFTNWRP